MNRYQKKLNKHLINQCWQDFVKWPHVNTYSDDHQAMCFFLCDTIHSSYTFLQSMHEDYQRFINEYNQAIILKQQHYCILNYCKHLGASARQLAHDKRAFSRYFDRDAVEDRFRKITGTKELQVHFACDRLAAISKNFLQDAQHLSKIEEACTLFFEYTPNPRLATKAFSSLLHSALHVKNFKNVLAPQTMHFLYRSALDDDIDLWTQCAAIAFLPYLRDETTLHNTFLKRLQRVDKPDDFFVRRKIVETLARCNLNNKLPFMKIIVKDPSPSVRQKSTDIIPHLPYKEQQFYWERFILEDSDSAVQGSAIIALGKSVTCQKTLQRAVEIIGKVFTGKNNDFVLRTTLKVMCDTMARLRDGNLASSWAKHSRNLIYEYKKSASQTHVKRWCSSTLEYLWCLSEDNTYQLYSYLQQRLRKIPPQKSKLFWRSIFRGHDKITVARVLAVLTQDDYHYDIHWGWPLIRITRGHVFKLRWWRVLHELRNPAPDKRVTTRHTVARSSAASFRVPSNINAEMSETKVPGEPLFIEEEQGWRPYLPLLDDILSANNCLWYRPTSIYTNEGVTLIKPPRFLLLRMWAYIRVTFSFSKYAALRNWRQNSQSAANSYLMSLHRLGFRFEFHDYPNKDIPIEPDKDILRFFPCILFFDATFWKYLEILLEKFQLYFFSAYSNDTQHLVIFISLISIYFLGKHVLQNRLLAKARNAIPLVIGGWGTRGKSGTERLKAALINSLGYSLVSKTTGCEAMFLYCHPFAKTEEIFLFRPYDKATIWEQYNLVRLAANLDSDVFLWECMALNPAYVKILQCDWMRDDLSTITNTYPDHEDIQGPAGKDVAETIAVFTPEKSKVIISEEQMLPLLREQAQRKKTDFASVNWLDAGLIPQDVLERFPYKEHPYNIALVLKIAAELKIPYDYAIKEMADRIVADIGVLKTYPAATINKRQLEFNNGMSANERLGALGNWKRLQLDKQDIYEEPHIWVSTVVNNRADRIPRSKVFARILVRDIEADRHFLIGNNLDGLMSYIDDEWEEYIATIHICDAHGKLKSDALQILENAAQRLRIAYKKEQVQQRLQVMVEEKIAHLWQNPQQLQQQLQQHDTNPPQILNFHQQNITTLREYELLQQKITQNANASKLQIEFRKQLYKWFKRKIVVIENYHATGDQVIETITQNTPPSVYNRIIGLQNIKGTGLDFVYRWQAWQNCYDICLKICSENTNICNEGIQELTTFIDHGVLTYEHTQHTIQQAIKSSSDSKQKSKLHMLEQSIKDFKKRNDKQANSTTDKNTSKFSFVLKLVEQILDAGDAIKRRKKANQIYTDLHNQRISIKRAIYELKKINHRQKGGWLVGK